MISGVVGNNMSGNTSGVQANSGVSGAPASSTYKVPFVSPVIAGYAVETAIEEGKHVAALRAALGSLAVSTTPDQSDAGAVCIAGHGSGCDGSDQLQPLLQRKQRF